MWTMTNGISRIGRVYCEEYYEAHPHLKECILRTGLTIKDLEGMEFPVLKLIPGTHDVEIELLKMCATEWLRPKKAEVCHLCLQLSNAASAMQKKGQITESARERIMRSTGWIIRDSLYDRAKGQLPALGSFLSLNNQEMFRAIVVIMMMKSTRPATWMLRPSLWC